MEFGAQKQMLNKDGTKYSFDDNGRTRSGVESTNKRFNPKTKQVFAALNYARRPHGSSTFYGDGFLILSDKLKVNAMYYPGDTFALPEEDTSTQVAYGVLGTIIAYANNPKLREAIIKSCYLEASLGDSDQGYDLLEAHVFDKISFRKHLKSVCIPIRYRGTP
jgi:hypothetical protein